MNFVLDWKTSFPAFEPGVPGVLATAASFLVTTRTERKVIAHCSLLNNDVSDFLARSQADKVSAGSHPLCGSLDVISSPQPRRLTFFVLMLKVVFTAGQGGEMSGALGGQECGGLRAY
jgi:hypothetical protein